MSRAEAMPWYGRLGRATHRIHEWLGPYALPLSVSWLLLGTIIALSLFILYMTFVPGLPTDPGLTLRHWSKIVSPYVLTKVIPNTVTVGLGSVFVALCFACPLAWLLNRTALPFRKTFITFMALVVIIPDFVTAMGWIMLLNERIGVINKLVATALGIEMVPLSVSNVFGMAWVTGLMLTPTMFFIISGPIRALDPSLEEASLASGATKWQTFLRVSLPLVWPGILGGAIYIFMTAISIFEVPAMLGAAGGKAPVLASELFYAVHPGIIEPLPAYGAAGVYGVLIAFPSLIGLYFYHRVLKKAHLYRVVTGKGYQPKDLELGRLRYVGVLFVLLYLTVAVFLPLVVLIWTSLLPYLQMPSVDALSNVSLKNYYGLLDAIGGTIVVRNTVFLVAIVTALVLFFSFVISWLVVRTTLRARSFMDTVALLPHAVPGLAFAFALMMIGILSSKWMPWLALNGSLTLIVMAHLVNRLAYGTRVTNAALLQIHPELEECSSVCGSGHASTMARIILPLVRPSLVYAGLWTALLSLREVSMALFLASPQNMVLSVGTWILWQSGKSTTAAAAAVSMVSILALLILLTLVLAGGGVLEQRRPYGSLRERNRT